MKTLFLILIALNFYLPSFAQANLEIGGTRTIAGTVTNYCANRSAGVKMVLSREQAEYYRLQGVFDNKNLFGRFDMVGKPIPYQSSKEIQFVGEIYFGGNDGSGFPADSKTTFVITFLMDYGTIKGIYHIGKILPYFDFEQYGTMDLYYDKN